MTRSALLCPECQRWNLARAKFNPAQSATASMPMEHVSFDLFSGVPTTGDGYSYCLVVVDVFSRFVWLRPLHTKGAREVAQALFLIVSEYGIPEIWSSDNGTEFRNRALRTPQRRQATLVPVLPPVERHGGAERQNGAPAHSQFAPGGEFQPRGLVLQSL